MSESQPATSKQQFEETANKILGIARNFLTELKMERALRGLSLKSHLDRDLSLDSLSKVELFHLIEHEFSVSLSEEALYEAETLKDVCKAILEACPTIKVERGKYLEKLEQAQFDPKQSISLTEILLKRKDLEPDRPHIYLQDFNGDEQVITYGRLYRQAKRIADGLAAHGIRPKDTVAIMLPTSEDFFISFFGVLLIGAVPVPIYPPFRPDQIEEYALREAKILNQAKVRLLITFHRVEKLSSILGIFVPSLKTVCTTQNLLDDGKNSNAKIYTLKGSDPGLIQFTSGSTSIPKGVLLSQDNLLNNIRLSGEAIKVTPADVVVSWLPLYHDMGLIGTWLGSFYFGVPVCILSPLTFLTHPERWLWAIHYHQATLSAAPNFAYELCIRRIQPEMIEGLDLSTWRLSFNGAEAVNPKTIARFTKKFAAYGFKPETMFPVYGLAESSVALAFPNIYREPVIDEVERDPLERDNKAIPAHDKHKHTLKFVGVGNAIPQHELKICDDDFNELPDRQVGKLFFKGPSIMQGYYNAPEATAAVKRDGWVDSGDLAYIAEGELYIVGRKKDIIIKAGRNYYPEEVEEITSQVPGVRKGCVIALGVLDQRLGTEKLVVVTETRETKADVKERMQKEISEKLAIVLGNPPDEILLVPPKTVPKTSSGKLQRSACKQMYIEGKLKQSKMPAWWQMLRLLLKATRLKVVRGLKLVVSFFYTILTLTVLVTGSLIVGLASFILPSGLFKRFIPVLSKCMLAAALVPVKVKGKEHLKAHDTMVFVANHASYIDALLVASILPAKVRMVGKRELEKMPIIRRVIKKLNYITVDRLDFVDNLQSTDRMKETLKENHSILVFPEGTFLDAPGVRPFKLGAFKIAVETNTPVCPIAIKGSRNILRGTQKLFNWGKVELTVCEPVKPQSQAWEEIPRLELLCKQEITKHCGEPSLEM